MKPTLLLATLSLLAATPSALGSIYTVRPGDSIESIARKTGCKPAALAASNRLKLSSVIHPGQKLKIPTSSPAPAKTPVSNRETPAAPTEAKTHTISAGETFFSVSKKYGIPVETLIAANPKLNPKTLRPGQVVQLTPSAAAASAATSVASAPPRTPESNSPAPRSPETTTPPSALPAEQTGAKNPPQEPLSSPSPEKAIRSVTVESEMTYGDFAAAHGTDTARLNDLNGLDLTNATVLAKGSELYVPAQP